MTTPAVSRLRIKSIARAGGLTEDEFLPAAVHCPSVADPALQGRRRALAGERSWSATQRHYARASSASSWAHTVAMKAETRRRALLPARASALRMKWTRQR
ncbi:hypothetical protein BJS_08640 [Bradyrhizobium japonicum SEMIA 5079]|uniref:ID263 n=2 Tax=Bradyrhizobium TaxID=374 RepID=Q9ANF3_BRAJP|nr:ID263 [Bradyrhizobium japonicum]AHY57092.1 hypothetical protein BJS_08640 [Bradyrhizobium japonicum SEMIA 5079]KGJ66077.1 hypothetical protein BJA5080_08180 [Bradyrhizobium diazoefficiens SEMIA 5080]